MVRARNYQYIDILTWLATKDVNISYSQLSYFVRKSGEQLRYKSIVAPDSYSDRFEIYLSRLLSLQVTSYNIKNLRLKGPGWNVVTMQLHRENLIESMGGGPRTTWKVLVSKDVLQSWLDNKISQYRGDKS